MPATGIKAVILAAGFGSRLRPLTESVPKPLVPFAGSTPLELALWRLKQTGIQQVAINAHYLPEQIEKVAKANPFDQDIFVSREEALLGTGGAFNPLRNWQGDSDLLVYNGDIVSDMDLTALVTTHRKTKAHATMAMLPEVIPGESGFFCNNQGQVVGFGPDFGSQAPKRTVPRNFACAQVLSRAMIEGLPNKGSFSIIEAGYLPALKEQKPLFSYLHKGFWHDLRNPWFYLEALKDYLRLDDLADRLGVSEGRRRAGLQTLHVRQDEVLDLPFRATGPILLDESTTIDRTAKLGPFVVVEPGGHIGAGAEISESVLLKGADVPAGGRIHNRIFGPGVDIPVNAPSR